MVEKRVSLLCIAWHLGMMFVVGETMETSAYFHGVRDSEGMDTCATDRPYSVLLESSEIRCAEKATRDTTAYLFNYFKVDKRCEIFNCRPVNYGRVPGCRAKQREGNTIFPKCAEACPPSFTYLQGPIKCYRLESDHLDWEPARQRCRSLFPGAHSVVIPNNASQEAVISFLTSPSNQGIVSQQCTVNFLSVNHLIIWTAGQRRDLTSQSPFYWKIDDNNWAPITYGRWDTGQPDYWASAESCLNIYSYPNFSWNDGPCGGSQWALLQSQMCVLCEVDMF